MSQPMSQSQVKLKADPLPNVLFRYRPPESVDDCAEIEAGLSKSPKSLNPKYFYDTHGSELFEQITQQPEYYPTRTERKILTDYAEEIAEHLGKSCVLIEPGSGSSEKVRLLLDALRPRCYVPIDIAAEFLHQSVVKLGAEFPWLDIRAICADFAHASTLLGDLPKGRKVVFYPGSTLGNMVPSQAQTFLSKIRMSLGEDGAVLLGLDLHKDSDTLNAAYNDSQGVTRAFNMNALTHVNRILGANFEPSHFEHRAFYNEQMNRIEMHLVSQLDHIVRLGKKAIAFSEGETIHTENSYKYRLEQLDSLLKSTGLVREKSWVDEKQLFSVSYLKCVV